ncbi:MAG: class I mannose-6-phosphate isomerase [Bacteroidales bacterium]|nr:class I mannose-6-phosphate isomerase [Bacteroidales bacterium]
MSANYQQKPFVEVPDNHQVYCNWEEIGSALSKRFTELNKKKTILVVEYYQGVFEEEITDSLLRKLSPDYHFTSRDYMLDQTRISEMIRSDLTDDRIFGYMTRLTIDAFFDPSGIAKLSDQINQITAGTIVVTGIGASYIAAHADILVYADMARWEIQLRMREHLVDNIGLRNRDTDDWMFLYKHGFFVDWRVCDRWKKKIMDRWDYVLDTNDRENPKMVSGKAIREGLDACLARPFSLMPFFDPGPWGGQWMKEKCNLDPSQSNYAWCFNCVPEENSLLLKIGGQLIEIPSINLVFYNPEKLLGSAVHARFGDEFPIRFDFLDTIGGGNLSLQVHPLTEYIQQQFGMHYTQDESYYLMEAKPGARVYLGLKENIDAAAMISDLKSAQSGQYAFPAENHVQTWEAKKHDHFLIPAGTVHCSGENCMVLEISATPYIFTFKLWDWGRLGLDGKPRPINIEHGRNSIQWNRTTNWTRENLVNKISKVGEGDGWIEERTGLHEREFMETRRHWFTKKVYHKSNGVNVLCLVEGDTVIVESPLGEFEPFEVHYAETFIVPGAVREYSIRPAGQADKYATIKAYIRTNA